MSHSMKFIGVLIVLATSLSAADWPQFRGPNGDGTSPETGLTKDWAKKPPVQIWRLQVADKGYGGLSAAGGKFCYVDHYLDQDVVHVVDIATGKDKWTAKYNNMGLVNYGFTRATPAFANGKLYTLSRHGVVVCFDAEKGTQSWNRDLVGDFQGKEPFFGYAHSPVVDGDHVIVCPGGPDAAIVCLDAITGKDIWKGGGSDTGGYSTPVVATIDNKKQYVFLSALNIMGVDAESGKQLWSNAWRTQFDENIASPVVQGDTVFISSAYNHGCLQLGISGDKADLNWQNKLMQCHFNTPLFADGCYYANSGRAERSGELVCLDAKTGAPCWKEQGFDTGGIVHADGVNFMLTGNTGELIMFKPDARHYHELGRMKVLNGPCWTPPILADGKIFVRNVDTIICLNLK
jgi:outer membrane protein assembly factor BamB